MSQYKPKLKIVLGTGGVRILSAVGVLLELEKAGFQFSSAAGCSAGALIAALVSAGKTALEIEHLLIDTNIGAKAGKKSLPWQRVWGPCAKYSTSGLPSVICNAIGDQPRLSDLLLPFEAAVVDLFNLDLQIYSNRITDTLDTSLYQVLSDCVAVPGLYPASIRDGRLLIDGAFSTQASLALSQTHDSAEMVIMVTCHVPKTVRRPSNVQDLLERTVETSIAINDKFVLEQLCQLGGLQYPVVIAGETTWRSLPYVHWINIECSPPVEYDQFDLDEVQKRQLITSGREFARKYLNEKGIRYSPPSKRHEQSKGEEANAQAALIAMFNQIELKVINNFTHQGDIMEAENNYISGGQQASVGGRFNTLQNNTFTQVWSQIETDIDLKVLAAQLTELRQAGLKEVSEPEHAVALGAIAGAEIAAKEGDGPTTMKHLSVAGKWAFDLASKIGVVVAAEALKKALGL